VAVSAERSGTGVFAAVFESVGPVARRLAGKPAAGLVNKDTGGILKMIKKLAALMILAASIAGYAWSPIPPCLPCPGDPPAVATR
jgi:hypothetical protein